MKDLKQNMRRKDREIIDDIVIDGIIESCTVIRLGLNDESAPYVFPMSFGYEKSDEQRIFWFHCANAGKKLDLLRKDNRTSFELEADLEVVSSDNPAEWTMKYKSVMGSGILTIVTDTKEKNLGLNKLLGQYDKSGKTYDFSANLKRTTVLKLDVTFISCKAHI
jgi:uncharacterized protein